MLSHDARGDVDRDAVNVTICHLDLTGVQAHRGTLSASNLGTGARFEVRLPLAGE